MISPLLSARLHCLRWVAAALVVASHLKPLLFVDHADLHERGLLIDCFYLLTGLGHEAVIVFFVMSGLLVGGLSLERHRAQRFVPEEFLIQRFSRIYIVLAPALLAGFFWDQVGLMHFNAAGLYTESPKFRMDGVAAHQLSWRLLLANGLMLQHIAVPVFGSNGALWSISYEWWCYLLFFFCFIFIAGCRRHDPRFHYGAIACLLLLLLPPAVLRYFCIWLIGLAVLGAPLRRLRCHPLPAYALLLAVLLWSRLSHDNLQPVFGLQRELVCDLAIAGACFLLFSALNQCNRRPRPGHGVHKALADFSYTTYLVHLPCMLLSVSLLNRVFGMPVMQQPSAGMIACFLLVGCMVYAYSYCFSLMTERHTDAMRHWLQRRMSALLVDH